MSSANAHELEQQAGRITTIQAQTTPKQTGDKTTTNRSEDKTTIGRIIITAKTTIKQIGDKTTLTKTTVKQIGDKTTLTKTIIKQIGDKTVLTKTIDKEMIDHTTNTHTTTITRITNNKGKIMINKMDDNTKTPIMATKTTTDQETTTIALNDKIALHKSHQRWRIRIKKHKDQTPTVCRIMRT
jgi:hypothetical protein